MGFRLCERADLIENEARAFRSPAGEVIVISRDGQTYAYHNSCPHLGINLEFNPDEFMDSENYFLICSNHGALFQVEDGLCVSGPCQGESLLSVPIQIRDGQVELIEH